MVQVMGILNVTPDSFYDGGRWADVTSAVARGCQMAQEGASIVDVGGESTRPHASEVDEEEELARVLPVVRALARELAPGVRVSIDTRKARVAREAVGAGATIINDVSASLWEIAAVSGAGWVAMHMKGSPATMMSQAHYDDVVSEVREYLEERASLAAAAGAREIWIDPGIGFAKTTAQNLTILRRLRELTGSKFPVAVGLSRKRFTGVVTSGEEQAPAPLGQRAEASLAGAVWAIAQGACVVRTHDVKATVDAARLVGSVRAA